MVLSWGNQKIDISQKCLQVIKMCFFHRCFLCLRDILNSFVHYLINLEIILPTFLDFSFWIFYLCHLLSSKFCSHLTDSSSVSLTPRQYTSLISIIYTCFYLKFHSQRKFIILKHYFPVTGLLYLLISQPAFSLIKPTNKPSLI